MQYREGCGGDQLSLLGFGCMRFTKKGGGIDRKKAEREILTAIRGGVNYFDTAYIYPGSEALLGDILAKNHCREKVFIATKLPLFFVRNLEGVEKVFQEEKKRLKTDYIDYYLMHMCNDAATWKRLAGWGMEEWIAKKKKSGEIRHIGFSYHGSQSAFRQVVDAYPWDFCQIQYNYRDENSQAGRGGLQYAHAKGLPVIIMEPLRGGRLVNLLPKRAKALFAREGKGMGPAEWAFRWLYDQPEVTCVLSGMNSVSMIRENLAVAGDAKAGSFGPEEIAFMKKVKRIIEKEEAVACTGCGYCMPCPKGVDIPGTFRCYNEAFSEGRRGARREYLQTTAMRREQSSASQCVGCGRCEKHCPQHLPIRRYLKQAAKELEGPVYGIAKKLIRLGRFY